VSLAQGQKQKSPAYRHNIRKVWGVMDIFNVLIVVIVSQMYTFNQTYQNVCINMYIFVYQLYFDEA
jgi:hypothetical protein